MRNRGRRAAFTLTEMLVAAALGTVVGTLMVKAYQGMAKAQGVAQGSADLREMGARSAENIYRELKHVKRLFNRPIATGGGANLTQTWLGRIPVEGLYLAGAEPKVEPGPDRAAPGGVDELVLPIINPAGGFVAGGMGPEDFDPAYAGNALLFLTLENKAALRPIGSEPAVVADFVDEVFGSESEIGINLYRLHLYFMAKKPVGNGPTLRQDSPFTYTLMHWKSKAYADFDEVDSLADAILNAWPGGGKPPKPPKGSKKPPKGTGRPAGVATLARDYTNALLGQMAADHQVAGLLNPLAEDATLSPAPADGPALYRLTASSAAKGPNQAIFFQADTTGGFATGDFRTALQGMARSDHGAIDLAFNTDPGGAYPGVPAGSLKVPAYGNPSLGVPFGFETVIAGPPAARQVLFRITLSGRALGARGNYAQAFQQMVGVAED